MLRASQEGFTSKWWQVSRTCKRCYQTKIWNYSIEMWILKKRLIFFETWRKFPQKTWIITQKYIYFSHLWENFSHVKQQGVCHNVALPFTLKSIWRERKNYGKSNILPCKNIVFKKSYKRNQTPARYYNFITNLKFQHKPKYHLEKILI
jgi:hypothetical protein